MWITNSLLYLFCSLLTCLHLCDAAPILTCANNQCSSSDPLQINLELGTLRGATTSYGGQRFTLPYAVPPTGALRFASPKPLTSFANAPNVYDASQLPKACMQQPDSRYGIDSDGVSEDCLYLTVYRPAPSQGRVGLPVLVWIHGGSFVSGSSSAPGLDGSYLASQNGVIVVTIQYRLGMFGFFSPPGFTSESAWSNQNETVQGNQGVRDAMLALKFVRDNIGAFGGDANSVTVGGQSSGAHLIRALLDSTAASDLFERAILHSDPANFGTQTAETSGKVSGFAMWQTGCNDLACLRQKSAQDVLGASGDAVEAGQGIDGAVAAAEVWRPFVGALTGGAFEQNASGGGWGKAVVFTNVENEAGSVVGQMLMATETGASTAELRVFPVSLTRQQLLEQSFNAGRGDTLSWATQYGMNTNVSWYPATTQVQTYAQSSDGLRRNLETILTQGMFTCATWFNAQRYAATARAYVALFETGIRYASNSGNDYCTDARVCHEDDIQLVFSNPSNLDDATARVVKEVQARWIGFMRSGNPNTDKYGGWQSVGTSSQSARVLRLGSYEGQDAASVLDTVSLQAGQYAGCGQVWGSEVKFDWQLYG